MDNAEATRINGILKTNFGRLDGHLPIFRLTWSTDETEYVVGAGRIKKYVQDDDRWILERLCESPESILPEFKYTYEPLWVFKHDDGTYQDPNEKAVIFLVHGLLYREAKKITIGDLDSQRALQEKKEVDEFIQIMEEEYPVLSSRRENGDAVFLGGLKSGS